MNDGRTMNRAALRSLAQSCAEKAAAGVDDLQVGDPLRDEVERLTAPERDRVEWFVAGAAWERRQREAASAAVDHALLGALGTAACLPSTPELLAEYQRRSLVSMRRRRAWSLVAIVAAIALVCLLVTLATWGPR